jgi:osmotically-inducible protein OsmY
VLDDRPGHADLYGAVEQCRYGTYGYSSEAGHPSSYVAESGGARSAADAARLAQGADQRPSPGADERLRELIRERLTEDPDIDAQDVVIAVNAGTVRLTGSVADARTRDVIEQCVENCGARSVSNQLLISARPG